ncbi:hypothetical protein IAU60_000448 [Kwoniella sp. DSM 27419]
MSKSAAFFEAIENRRSYYALKKETTLSNAQLQEIVEKAVKYAPTSFNGQQARAVLVTGKAHENLWEKIKAAHLATLNGDEKQIGFWTNKMDTEYKAAYGTVAFFDDQQVLNGLIGKMPFLAQAFPTWAQNSAGILQYIVWTALEAEGHGASLQHFAAMSPDTQTAITDAVGVPPTWISTALLPFGVPAGPPGKQGVEKSFVPVEERTKFIFE